MRDYDKELADSLDKSDQIAKLEAKVEELQRQLDEAQEMSKEIGDVAYISGSYDARKKAERQLAEREAVIERLRDVRKNWNAATGDSEECMYEIDAILAIPTDHTALDEAKAQVLEEAAQLDSYVAVPLVNGTYQTGYIAALQDFSAGLKRKADEIRSK